MAIQTKTIEVEGTSGETTGYAFARTAGTGVVASVTVVEVVADSGNYIVTLNWDDSTASNEPLGLWQAGVGAVAGSAGASNVEIVAGTDDYRIGISNVPSAADNASAVRSELTEIARLDVPVSDAVAAAGGTGIYAITVTCKESDDTPVSGARVTIQGTSYTETSDSDGEVRFNVDAGVYSLVTSPPSGYQTPVNVGVTVVDADVDDAEVVLTVTDPSSPSDVGWVG